MLGGTPLSLYCNFTTKLERAPQTAAASIASAPKNWPSELTDWTPTTKATPKSPTTSPTTWMRFTCALRSSAGAKSATNIGVEETNTPARPEGTLSSPSEISMNGAAIANTPSKIAGRGRRTISPSAARSLPPFDEHYSQDPKRTYRGLEEGDLHRREILERVLDEQEHGAPESRHEDELSDLAKRHRGSTPLINVASVRSPCACPVYLCVGAL